VECCFKRLSQDVTDEEWAFVAPYLNLMREDAPQREHSLRSVFNALRWLIRAGAPHAPQRLSTVGDGLSSEPALDRSRCF
jgi:hypothetical protein